MDPTPCWVPPLCIKQIIEQLSVLSAQREQWQSDTAKLTQYVTTHKLPGHCYEIIKCGQIMISQREKHTHVCTWGATKKVSKGGLKGSHLLASRL